MPHVAEVADDDQTSLVVAPKHFAKLNVAVAEDDKVAGDSLAQKAQDQGLTSGDIYIVRHHTGG